MLQTLRHRRIRLPSDTPEARARDRMRRRPALQNLSSAERTIFSRSRLCLPADDETTPASYGHMHEEVPGCAPSGRRARRSLWTSGDYLTASKAIYVPAGL